MTENAPPAGWALDSLTCPTVSGPGTGVTFDGAKVNIALGFLGNVECTYVNKRQPQVRVVKVLDPANDPGKFDLQINGQTHADDVGNGGDTGFKQVTAGQPVTVGELAGAGTSLANYVSSVSCDSGKGGAAGTSHSFSVDFGDQVTCTITNTLKRGAIIVEKQTLPDGDPQVFAFTASYDADGFPLSDGQSNDSGALLPGTYSVAETVPAGWDLKSTVCTDGSPANAIAVGPDETVRCVFTNEKDANIVVEKQTNPNGDTQVFAFNASYDADGFSLSDGQQNDSGDLEPRHLLGHRDCRRGLGSRVRTSATTRATRARSRSQPERR